MSFDNQRLLRVHFHADCSFFSGAERMMPLIWNSPVANDSLEMSITYRSVEPFSSELQVFAPSSLAQKPLSLPTPFGRMQIDPDGGLKSQLKRINNMLRAFGDALLNYPRFALCSFRIWRVLKSDVPDVVHLNNGGWPGAISVRAAAVASKLAGVNRTVLVVNNMAFGYRSPERWLDYPIDRLVKNCVDVFVTASEDAGFRLDEVLNLRPSLRVRIPNSFPLEPEVNAYSTDPALSERDPEVVIVGSVGLLTSRKGQTYLVSAFSKLISDHPHLMKKVKLWLIGEGEDRKKIEDLVSELDLADRVRLFGQRADYFDIMKCMNIYVQPSVENEDSPLATLEAMKLKLPVIGSSVGGIKEQVVHAETGFLVPATDVTALAEALHKLIVNPELRRTQGHLGYQRSISHFSPDALVSNYLKLYGETSDCQTTGVYHLGCKPQRFPMV